MKLYILSLIISVFLFESNGQTVYSASRWYGFEGESRVEKKYEWTWNGYQYVNLSYCRRLDWYREWHSGYIYFWQWDSYIGYYRWVSQWQEGSFWHCSWSAWYGC